MKMSNRERRRAVKSSAAAALCLAAVSAAVWFTAGSARQTWSKTALWGIHTAAFLLWTAAWIFFARRTFPRDALGETVTIAVPFGAAAVSEIIQLWLEGHQATMDGFLSSLLGVVLATGLWVVFLRPCEAARFSGAKKGPPGKTGAE